MSGTSTNFCTKVVEYIKSIPGILKMIELFCDLLGVILCGAAPTIDNGTGHKGFFLFVSILALIITFVLFIIFLLSLNVLCLIIPWGYAELGWCSFISLFYFIASIVLATIASANGAYGAATFFGFAAFLTYTAEAVYHFLHLRSGDSGPGDRYQPRDQPNVS